MPSVVFFDSGIGGLAYVPLLRRMHPALDGAYVADRAYFPYGNRNRREIVSRVAALGRAVDELWKPSCLVLACNSASVFALEELRAALPRSEVVGVVPAIKQASRVTRGNIVVLGTKATVEADYTHHLELFADAAEVRYVQASPLVEAIEREAPRFSAPSIRTLIEDMKDRFENEDCVVLGCTHFLHVRSLIREIVPAATLVDSELGVVRRVSSLLGSEAASGEGRWQFFTTAPDEEERYRRIAEHFDLSFSGVL